MHSPGAYQSHCTCYHMVNWRLLHCPKKGCRVRRNFSDRSAHDTVLSSWMDKALQSKSHFPFWWYSTDAPETRIPSGCFSDTVALVWLVEHCAYRQLRSEHSLCHSECVTYDPPEHLVRASLQGQWRNPCALFPRDMDKWQSALFSHSSSTCER